MRSLPSIWFVWVVTFAAASGSQFGRPDGREGTEHERSNFNMRGKFRTPNFLSVDSGRNLLDDDGNTTISPVVNMTTLPSDSTQSSVDMGLNNNELALAYIYGSLIGAVVLACLIALILWCRWRYLKKEKVFGEGAQPSLQAGKGKTPAMVWVEPTRLDWRRRRVVGTGGAGTVLTSILDGIHAVALKEVYYTSELYEYIDPKCEGKKKKRPVRRTSSDAYVQEGDAIKEATILLREVEFLLNINHPRIVKVLGLTRALESTKTGPPADLHRPTTQRGTEIPRPASVDDLSDLRSCNAVSSRNIFVVMELLEGGSLASALYQDADSSSDDESTLPSRSVSLSNDTLSRGSSQSVQSTFNSDEGYVRVAYQIAAGMQYLHSMGIVHLDLKPENILIRQRLDLLSTPTNPTKYTEDSKTCDRASSRKKRRRSKVRKLPQIDVKICDFGLSVLLKHRAGRSTVRAENVGGASIVSGGTPAYMPPEALAAASRSFDPPDPKLYAKPAYDVYSYGILLWTLKTHIRPYDDILPRHLVERVTKGERPSPPLGQAAWRDPSHGACFSKLITSCIQSEPSGRPSFEQIISLIGPLPRRGGRQSSVWDETSDDSFDETTTFGDTTEDDIDSADDTTQNSGSSECLSNENEEVIVVES